MPAKGQKHTEEAKKKIREKRATQLPFLIGRYGITQEFYTQAQRDGLRWCRDCKKFLPPTAFYGKDQRCIECVKGRVQAWRDRRTYKQRKKDAAYFKSWRNKNHTDVRNHWMKRYGLTNEWYERQFEKQNGACAICKRPALNGRRYLCVDHCHKTRLVRGLLCIRCNAFISGIEDGLLPAAQKYLANCEPTQGTVAAY